MLKLQAHHPQHPVQLCLHLPRSKSLWARHLLLDQLEGRRQPLPADELISEDIEALSLALDAFERGETRIDVQESGTAMRLLLGYLALQTSQTLHLQGQGRQHQRPIAPLVEALRGLGARIDYLEQEGFPPLAIHPAEGRAETTRLDASASSQYLSALLLLAPQWTGRLTIDTRGYDIASRPYAEMTRALLAERGYHWDEPEEGLFIYLGKEADSLPQDIAIEGDWSATSYAFTLLSFLPVGSSCLLPSLRLPSLQGDAEALQHIFEELGIQTVISAEGISLKRVDIVLPSRLEYAMAHCPDLVPAVVVALLEQGVPFRLTGVAHLRIKESNRLLALQTELAKLGYPLALEDDALAWGGARADYPPTPLLDPHGDHRIAMALSLLALQEGKLKLDTPMVVAKSFPHYWEELEKTRLFTIHSL